MRRTHPHLAGSRAGPSLPAQIAARGSEREDGCIWSSLPRRCAL